MKGKKEHRVPLTDRAFAVLKDVRRLTSPPKAPDATGEQEEIQPEGIVFKASRGGALSDMALTMYLRRNGLGDVTVHGFRSSFRDWAGNATNYPRDVAELALAHTIGDAVERAYKRSDAIEKRRLLMMDWEAFTQSVVTPPPTKVDQITASKAKL